MKVTMKHLVYAGIHCKEVKVTLTNTYGYLSCIFALSTPGTEQRICRMCRVSPK